MHTIQWPNVIQNISPHLLLDLLSYHYILISLCNYTYNFVYTVLRISGLYVLKNSLSFVLKTHVI